jgi:hypothetical protein
MLRRATDLDSHYPLQLQSVQQQQDVLMRARNAVDSEFCIAC